jgi:hypothetical protein
LLIEQQKIVEEDICVGGERFRRPIGLAVAHIPIGEAVLRRCRNSGCSFFRNRKWRLLIPQVAYVIYPDRPGC